MTNMTDDKRIKIIKKILNILHNYKPNTSLQKMMDVHKGSYNDKLFAITGKEIHDAQHAVTCGHWAKAFAYENSLLPKDEQLDIKTMVSTHPDHLIDSLSNHTLPCVKMDDGSYYAIDPQVRDVDLPMIQTPIKVGATIKHIIGGLKNEPEYKIMALIDWTDKRLYNFDTFTKMASERNEKTKEIVAEIEDVLKSTLSSKRQEYIFREEALKRIPNIAKKMKVAVIESDERQEHIIEPVHRIVLELENKDGRKQQCAFAPCGNYAVFKNIDDRHKILWQKPLAEYVKLYDSIDDMEKRLLKNSTVEDLNTKKPEHKIQNDNILSRILSKILSKKPNNKLLSKILSKEQIKKDISVLARILIRAYVGWPKHDEETKVAVLDTLLQIYNAPTEMTVKEFWDKIKQIPSLIPDNHLQIVNGRPRYNQNFVGKNIASENKVNVLLTKATKDNIAIAGIQTLNYEKLSQNERHTLRRLPVWAKDYLPKSSALIVDLRGNSGGDDTPTNALATYLCGDVRNDPAETEYVRTTKDSIKITPKNKLDGIIRLPQIEEYLVAYLLGTAPGINKFKAYMKPIYILIDKRTGSSAERFVLAMRHHPMVKFVGDNSGGTEVFGNMSSTVYLPNSQANIRVGRHYRDLAKELGHDKYELHGFCPDIKCKEGEDAFEVALKDLEQYKQRHAEQIKSATKNLKIRQMAIAPKKYLKKREKTL